MDNWIMIVNPSSATESTGKTWEAFKKILTDAGLAVDHACTEYRAHAIELVQEKAAEGYRKFIAVGGDGTIHEVMTGLLRFSEANAEVSLNDFTLAVIPSGTGNDWIRTAMVPADTTEAAQCIVGGKTAKEDIVKLTFENGIYCMANIGGVALDADICRYTNNLKEKGYKGSVLYSLVAPYSILSKRFHPVEIECDGETVYKGKLYTAVLANGIYRGGGLKQNAEGTDWADGWMEVSIMPKVNHLKGLFQMLHIYKGDFAILPGIISRRFKKMSIKPVGKGKRDWVECDGELPGTLPVTVEITGEKINIIVP